MRFVPFLILAVSIVTLCICIFYIKFYIPATMLEDGLRTLEVQKYINDDSNSQIVPPDGLSALKVLEKEFKNQRDENALHSIVKLYLFGLNPTISPDKLTGLKLIQLINDNSTHFSPNLLRNCRLLWEQTSTEAYSDPDAFGTTQLPNDILEKVKDSISAHNDAGIERISCRLNTTFDEIEYFDDELVDVVDINQQIDEILLPSEQPISRIVVKSDSQNVHNMSVPNSIKVVVDKLKTYPCTMQYEDAVSIVNTELSSGDYDQEEIQNIESVMDSLSSQIHSKFMASEQHIFTMVVNKIMLSENKINLLRILCQNLASATEYGIVVCSTGKIGRMVSTFDAMDEDIPDIKPDWIIKQEISDLAVKIRTRVLSEASAEDRIKYETDGDDTLTGVMQDEFLNQLKITYVDDGILSETGITILASEFLNAF